MKLPTQKGSPKSWQPIVLKYSKPRISRSVWQMINTMGPYLVLWIVIVQVLKISPWLAIPFILLAAGFLVRIFIIFHDCGHGSFFKSKTHNKIVGKIFGIVAFTPYDYWTDSHRMHHQTVGNLDKRGFGDVWTLTVEEYKESSLSKKLWYRLFRDPLFLFGFGGPLNFLVISRFTRRTMTKKQKKNIYFTNLMLLIMASLMVWWIGWKTFLIIQIPIVYFSSMAGVYLFYLQHQYKDVKWSRTEDWDYKDMALNGSSFFKLPAVLRWFTGNIGFHHIHHLGPNIPNYNLKKCHTENIVFQEVSPISLFKSFHSMKLRLWDEKNQRIISFREMRAMAN